MDPTLSPQDLPLFSFHGRPSCVPSFCPSERTPALELHGLLSPFPLPPRRSASSPSLSYNTLACSGWRIFVGVAVPDWLSMRVRAVFFGRFGRAMAGPLTPPSPPELTECKADSAFSRSRPSGCFRRTRRRTGALGAWSRHLDLHHCVNSTSSLPSLFALAPLTPFLHVLPLPPLCEEEMEPKNMASCSLARPAFDVVCRNEEDRTLNPPPPHYTDPSRPLPPALSLSAQH